MGAILIAFREEIAASEATRSVGLQGPLDFAVWNVWRAIALGVIVIVFSIIGRTR